jgi:hypothetical protein
MIDDPGSMLWSQFSAENGVFLKNQW